MFFDCVNRICQAKGIPLAKGSSEILRRNRDWWPLLLAPAAMATVCIAYLTNHPEVYRKGSHEALAFLLLPLAQIGFLSCVLLYRCRIAILFAALTIALFCREWHFPGTNAGIKVALVVMGIWAYAWRDKIAVPKQLKAWIIATFATYFLSQFIARRGFRSLCLPFEEQLHVPWEEVLETTSHIMLIVLSIIVWRCARDASPSKLSDSKTPS